MRGICPVQVKVEPKKQIPPSPPRAKGYEVGAPTHPVVRKVHPNLFGLARPDGYARADEEPLGDAAAAAKMWRDDALADALEAQEAARALARAGLRYDANRQVPTPDAVQEIKTRPVPSLFDDSDSDSEDDLNAEARLLATMALAESMRAQIAALQARVTTLENEKMAAHVAEKAARWARYEEAVAVDDEAAWRKTIEEAEAAWHKKIEDALSSRLNDAPMKSKSMFSGMRLKISFSCGARNRVTGK